MSRNDIAHLTGDVLRWARQRAELEPAQLASLLGKGFTAAHISAWEQQESAPTLAQSEKLAEKLRVPLAILFMARRPGVELPLPDLRTIGNKQPTKPSLEFMEALNDSLVKQLWYREHQELEGVRPLPFIGKFHLGDSLRAVTQDMARTLGVDERFRQGSQTWSKFLSGFIERAEEAGVLVIVNSIVGHATSRPLRVREFRGFASSDPIAPLVFINGRDARAAQIFTLAHELAHLWIAQSGISNPNPKRRPSDFVNPVEQYCNQVAAEFLIPADNVTRQWDESATIEANVERIATFHRVSKIVAIIRARDLEKLRYSTSVRMIEEEYQRFEAERERQREKKGGPVFWTLFPSRNSVRLTDAVLTDLQAGRVLYRDAANLLGIKVGSLEKYSTHQSQR